MNPQWHYAEAERILDSLGDPMPSPSRDADKALAREAVRQSRIALAQVHATLACAQEPNDVPAEELRDLSGEVIKRPARWGERSTG